MPNEQLPIDYGFDPSTGQPLSLPVDSEPNPIAAKLLGIGQERYQLWPERMVRSAVTLPGDVASGQLPILDPQTGHTSEKVIERAQDLAGMAGGGLLLEKPGVATLGSGAVRQAPKAAEIAPAFYSGLEKAVETAKPTIATADQWLGYLKNQPGVKSEELATVLKELPSGPITKEALGDIVKANKVELGEVTKGEVPIVTKPNPEEPHILEVYHPDDPTGEVNGMWGEIIKKDGKFNVNIPEIPRKSFDSQAEAEAYISKQTNLGSDTKFHQYQLPGGEPGSYKEMLLTLPEADKKYAYDAFNPKTQQSKQFASRKEAEDFANKDTTGNTIVSEIEAGKENFKSSHWDEPNVLAHIRMNDRNVEGSKTLHLEEIQSDWHQKGRKEGYKLNPDEFDRLFTGAAKTDEKLIAANAEHIMGNPSLEDGLNQAVKENIIGRKEADDYIKLTKNENGTVPDAPFKKNWDDLALKKMIHKAASEGYEGISWTPGEAQAARYDLSKQVDKVNLVPHESIMNGGKVNFRIDAFKDNKKVIEHYAKDENEVASIVGKEVAEKLFKNRNQHGAATAAGEDLKIGGEGMKSFYDKMLVDKANALAKKYGSRVEQKEISKGWDAVDANGKSVAGWDANTPKQAMLDWIKSMGGKYKLVEAKQPIHHLPLTPELKKKALSEGFPLFSSSPIITPVDHDPFEKKKFKLVPVQGNPFQ